MSYSRYNTDTMQIQNFNLNYIPMKVPVYSIVASMGYTEKLFRYNSICIAH